MGSFETQFGRVGVMVLTGFLLLLGASMAAPAEAKKPWQPILVDPNPHGLKRLALTGSVGPHGGTVKCHGRPLRFDPRLVPPRRRSQTLQANGISTGPGYVARCGRRGKLAWYLSTRDPLRKKRFQGSRRFSIRVGRMKTSELERGGPVVSTGGCVPDENGVAPPCVPIPPLELVLPSFRVYPEATIRLSAVVGLESTELADHTGGDAEVTVQMTVDGVAIGPKAKTVLNGDTTTKIRLKNASRGYRGRHVVGLRFSGRGYNYVNVNATSLDLKAFVSRRMG